MEQKNTQENSHKKNAGITSDTFSSKAPDLEAADELYDRSLCSATDCTGLIPALPQSDAELTSYEELYHFIPEARKVR